MPFAFPNNPTVGQQSVQNGRTYQWSGYAWDLVNNISTHASTHSSSGSDPITIDASQVSNFNSSVSGLLPTISNSGDNRVLTSTGTSTGINAEDSLTFNGSSLAVPSGSVTVPSITAIGDSDTGLYFAGSDSISMSTSGIRRLNINPAGYVAIGSNGITGITLNLSRQIAGSVASHGVVQQGIVQSDVTNNVVGFYNIMNIAAAGFTLPLYSHFTSAANPPGSGSTVTAQIGYYVSPSMTGASSNLGFRGALASASGNWNLYLDGAAQNFILGNVGIGSGKLIPSCALDVNGLIAANSGNFTSNLQIGNNNLTNTNTTNIVNSANIYLWSNFR